MEQLHKDLMRRYVLKTRALGVSHQANYMHIVHHTVRDTYAVQAILHTHTHTHTDISAN